MCSDDVPTGTNVLHHKSLNEWNFVIQTFVKQGLAIWTAVTLTLITATLSVLIFTLKMAKFQLVCYITITAIKWSWGKCKVSEMNSMTELEQSKTFLNIRIYLLTQLIFTDVHEFFCRSNLCCTTSFCIWFHFTTYNKY